MTFTCTVCNGRGWILRGREGIDVAEYCLSCDGRGKLTLSELAASIDEDPRTFENVIELRCRSATAKRVFDKLMKRWVYGIRNVEAGT